MTLSTSPVFNQWLKDTRLCYTIEGYANSSAPESELSKGIREIDGAPHILKEGVWTKWDDVASDLHYDKVTKRIQDTSERTWNYLYPNGLTPQERNGWIGAVHKLSQAEMEAVHAQGRKFSQNVQNPRHIQVVSSGNNFIKQFGSHIGIRFIDEQGLLYSISFEIPSERSCNKGSFFQTLATRNAVVASLDFTEFKRYDVKRITTIPVSPEAFDRTLNKVRELANANLRLNFLSQNCTDLAAYLLHEVGVQVPHTSKSALQLLFDIAVPTSIRKCIQKCVDVLPSWLIGFIDIIIRIITIVPTILKNLIFLALGVNRELPGLAPQSNEASGPFLSYRPLIQHWTDIFKDNPVGDPFRFIEWQQEQPSTQEIPWDKTRFYIVN